MRKKNNTTEWINEENNLFYDSIQTIGLKKFAAIAGLSTGCDLDILKPYWSKTRSILDIGAGYGRAINYLLQHDYKGTITAIERNNSFFEYLVKHYSHYQNITLLQKDFLTLPNFNEQFDLIIILWLGIADFSKKQQVIIFKKLRELLNDRGTIIIDTLPDHIQPLFSEDLGDRNCLIKSDNASIKSYLVSADEIKMLAKNSGFPNIEKISYHTTTQRERWLHIIS